MNERLLQFIWQHQYISKARLTTTGEEVLQIIHPGTSNCNQGPDFLNARIKIGDTLWVGNIEVHLCTSDWKKHAHERDENYKNVILHVVWKHDHHLNNIPVLELIDKVSSILIHKYENLSRQNNFIPCESMLGQVPDVIITDWKNRLAHARLEKKASLIKDLFYESGGDWEKVCWWLIARNFGSHLNSDSFEQIARSLSPKIMTKHRKQNLQLEALLMGQAGLLEKSFNDDYPRELQKQYEFLRKVYKLQPVTNKPKFLRMRPANFPTIRLSQLGTLLTHSPRIFSIIRDTSLLKNLEKLFDIKAVDYWNDHYSFDEPTSFKLKRTGIDLINNLFLNTICPLLVAYSDYHQDISFRNRAIEWLQAIRFENNSIINGFIQLGLEIKSAFDSQALIELKKQFCEQKKCLDCAIGVWLLNR